MTTSIQSRVHDLLFTTSKEETFIQYFLEMFLMISVAGSNRSHSIKRPKLDGVIYYAHA